MSDTPNHPSDNPDTTTAAGAADGTHPIGPDDPPDHHAPRHSGTGPTRETSTELDVDQVAAALARLPSSPTAPVLATLHPDSAGTDPGLEAVRTPVPARTWAQTGVVPTIRQLAAHAAALSTRPPIPVGYALLQDPRARLPEAGWIADHHGTVHSVHAAPEPPSDQDNGGGIGGNNGNGGAGGYVVVPCPGDVAGEGIPPVGRALAGLALAAAGHHPAAPTPGGQAPILLVTELPSLRAALVEAMARTGRPIAAPDTVPPPAQVWVEAPQVLLDPLTAVECLDLPLRDNVVLLLPEPHVPGQALPAELVALGSLLGAEAVAWPAGDQPTANASGWNVQRDVFRPLWD